MCAYAHFDTVLSAGRYIGLLHRYFLLTASFAQAARGQPWTSPRMHGDATAQVRQTKVGAAIAAIRRAEQRIERLVPRDGKQLTIAKSPASR